MKMPSSVERGPTVGVTKWQHEDILPARFALIFVSGCRLRRASRRASEADPLYLATGSNWFRSSWFPLLGIPDPRCNARYR